MKLKLIFGAVISAFVFNTATAQTDVVVNPIGLLFGSYTVSAEQGLNSSFGAAIEGSYLNRQLFDIQYTGYSPNAQIKYYYSPKNGNDKWYFGAFFAYSSLKASDGDDEIEISNTSLGFVSGYKTVSKGGFVFESAAGFGRSLNASYKFNGEEDEDFNEIGEYIPVFYSKLAIGYRFGNRSSGGGGSGYGRGSSKMFRLH
ncbi:MAG: hypothetical protein ACPGEC_06260 [Flavobacteriales bacterium]